MDGCKRKTCKIEKTRKSFFESVVQGYCFNNSMLSSESLSLLKTLIAILYQIGFNKFSTLLQTICDPLNS